MQILQFLCTTKNSIGIKKRNMTKTRMFVDSETQ